MLLQVNNGVGKLLASAGQRIACSAMWEGPHMNWCRSLVILVVIPVFALPAAAGLFSRRPQANATQRVPELVATVRSDPDERKRTSAVEELRQYDAKAFPEIIPSLVDVLQNDAKAGVRLAALHSLAGFRPVSQQVGEALEKAVANDQSLRVRLQARTTLMTYHLSGYHAARKAEAPVTAPTAPKTSEPPLAVAPPSPPVPRLIPVAPPTTVSTPPPRMTPGVTGGAQPMPMGTPEPPLIAAPPVVPGPTPAPAQGPDLRPNPW
jgi:hypothetical protein